MPWYLLTKKSLLKMDGSKAIERIRTWPSKTAINTLYLAPDDMIVDLEREEPEFASAEPAPEPAPVKPPGTSAPKPPVKWRKSPNFSARGSAIDRVILHYTTGGTAEGALSWFEKPESQVSAHYVIDKDGTIYQCVSDDRKAWHAYGENDDSIGIEHVARKGERLTPEQAKASAALIAYLKAQYKLINADVTAHRFTNSNKGRTDCPGDLWKTESELHAWLEAMVPDGFSAEPMPAPKEPENVATLTTNKAWHPGTWGGLYILVLTIGSEVFYVASGARGAQNFRRPTDPRSVPGNLEPIPQGRYRIGPIEFAGGKDNYEGSFGAGLGPVWVGLDADFSDDRGSFGIHGDGNIGSAPGSAGCVVLRDITDLKRFVAALRKHDPKVLHVDWAL
jgi:N-acetyl-anhydromuramyl-L-alanine amidase AmpD